MTRGYFAVGVYHPMHEVNVGTLWRSAAAFGAAFVFTVGKRYRPHQASDTAKAPLHTPLFHFASIDDLHAHLPHGCPLVGVEQTLTATALHIFPHPERAAYLLGAEDSGLPAAVLERCHYVTEIRGASPCLNVAVAGSIVLYDRSQRGTIRARTAA